jgi:hypothetical protein
LAGKRPAVALIAARSGSRRTRPCRTAR